MEGRDPFPDESRESILMSISGGEKGLRFSGAWKLGVPLEQVWYVGELFGLHRECQVPFRI